VQVDFSTKFVHQLDVEGDRSAWAYGACGVGKSGVIALTINAWLERHPDERFVVVTDQTLLRGQMAHELSRFGIDTDDIFELDSTNRRSKDPAVSWSEQNMRKRILIMNYQTGEALMKEPTGLPAGLTGRFVGFDEAQHGPAPGYNKLIGALRPTKVIAVSPILIRPDGLSLSSVYGRCVGKYYQRDGVRDGVIIKPEWIPFSTSAMEPNDLRSLVRAEAPSFSSQEKVDRSLDWLFEHKPDFLAYASCNRVRGAHEYAQMMRAKFASQYGQERNSGDEFSYVEVLDGKAMADPARAARMKEAHVQGRIRVLVLVGVVHGIDNVKADTMIMLDKRPLEHMIQLPGRVARVDPDNDAKHSVVLDPSGTLISGIKSLVLAGDLTVDQLEKHWNRDGEERSRPSATRRREPSSSLSELFEIHDGTFSDELLQDFLTSSPEAVFQRLASVPDLDPAQVTSRFFREHALDFGGPKFIESEFGDYRLLVDAVGKHVGRPAFFDARELLDVIDRASEIAEHRPGLGFDSLNPGARRSIRATGRGYPELDLPGARLTRALGTATAANPYVRGRRNVDIGQLDEMVRSGPVHYTDLGHLEFLGLLRHRLAQSGGRLPVESASDDSEIAELRQAFHDLDLGSTQFVLRRLGLAKAGPTRRAEGFVAYCNVVNERDRGISEDGTPLAPLSMEEIVLQLAGNKQTGEIVSADWIDRQSVLLNDSRLSMHAVEAAFADHGGLLGAGYVINAVAGAGRFDPALRFETAMCVLNDARELLGLESSRPKARQHAVVHAGSIDHGVIADIVEAGATRARPEQAGPTKVPLADVPDRVDPKPIDDEKPVVDEDVRRARRRLILDVTAATPVDYSAHVWIMPGDRIRLNGDTQTDARWRLTGSNPEIIGAIAANGVFYPETRAHQRQLSAMSHYIGRATGRRMALRTLPDGGVTLEFTGRPTMLSSHNYRMLARDFVAARRDPESQLVERLEPLRDVAASDHEPNLAYSANVVRSWIRSFGVPDVPASVDLDHPDARFGRAVRMLDTPPHMIPHRATPEIIDDLRAGHVFQNVYALHQARETLGSVEETEGDARRLVACAVEDEITRREAELSYEAGMFYNDFHGRGVPDSLDELLATGRQVMSRMRGIEPDESVDASYAFGFREHSLQAAGVPFNIAS
jgi:superfamily II DNA or RNA helicase